MPLSLHPWRWRPSHPWYPDTASSACARVSPLKTHLPSHVESVHVKMAVWGEAPRTVSDLRRTSPALLLQCNGTTAWWWFLPHSVRVHIKQVHNGHCWPLCSHSVRPYVRDYLLVQCIHFRYFTLFFLFFWTNQIDFLNSVIVDLQRKNQDLKMKVEMMSEAALNGNGDDLNNYDRYFILSSTDCTSIPAK